MQIAIKNAGVYHIYEDSRSQLLIVESPVTGVQSFEWHLKYKLWMSVSKEYHLEAFLKEEMINKVKSTFNMK